MVSRLTSHKGARFALVIVALLVAAGLIARGRTWWEHRARVMEVERLRTRLVDLRSDVESCRAAVERERAAFERYRVSVDSLLDEVREYESLDERGVPAERYDAYLETFDRYNNALPGWQARADSLEAHDEACRDLTTLHNETVEALRRGLDEAGVSPGPAEVEP